MAMNEQETTAFVRKLMTAFAERTGLVGGRAPTRYLWTDAFAVCNLLELERRTGDDRYRELALRLVEQVHRGLALVQSVEYSNAELQNVRRNSSAVNLSRTAQISTG